MTVEYNVLMENNTKVMQAITEKDQQDCFSIRIEVFVEEQGVPSEEELDELDETSFHAIARINTYPVGTGRLIPEGNNNGRIGRMGKLGNGWDLAGPPGWAREGSVPREIEKN